MQAEMKAFVERVETGGQLLIPWNELRDVTLATFIAVERALDSHHPLLSDPFLKV